MNKYDKVMMDTAKLWSKLSTCKKRQVGAVIAKDNRIISIGYNGTIAGSDNDCETMCEICDGTGCMRCNHHGYITNTSTIHAEENAILFATRNGISTDNTTIYITTSPCIHCAKLIINAGIKKVYFKESYKDLQPMFFLEEHGVSCTSVS